MADPDEKLTVEELAEIQRLLIALGNRLTDAKDEQEARWTLVKEMVNSACLALLTMRQDLNDEKKDQGPPFLLSCLLSVALATIPLTALSAAFFDVLMLSVQRRLARAEFTIQNLRSLASTNLQRAAHTVPVRRELSYRRKAGELRRTADEEAEKIKRTEEMIAKFSKLYEPEVSSMLHNAATDISEWATKPLYEHEQPVGKKHERKPGGEEKNELKRAEDVPLVAIQNNLLDYIRSCQRVEAVAEKRVRDKLAALFDLATTTVNKNFRKKIEAYHGLLSREERPKDRREAKAKIEALYKQVAAELTEEGVLPKSLRRDELFDVQLIIESLIWCATFDFMPRNVLMKELMPGPYGNIYTAKYVLEPPPLPQSLWDKLTKRYIDPDTYLDPSQPPKTFKEAGTKQGQPPELRLAYYFGGVLFPGLTSENNAAILRLNAVMAQKPGN